MDGRDDSSCTNECISAFGRDRVTQPVKCDLCNDTNLKESFMLFGVHAHRMVSDSVGSTWLQDRATVVSNITGSTALDIHSWFDTLIHAQPYRRFEANNDRHCHQCSTHTPSAIVQIKSARPNSEAH